MLLYFFGILGIAASDAQADQAAAASNNDTPTATSKTPSQVINEDQCGRMRLSD